MTADMLALATAPPGRLMDFLERTYETFGAKLYHYLLGMLRSPADAEDVLQTLFVKLAQRDGDEIEDLPSYLFSAARNEALRWMERKRRPEPEVADEVELLEPTLEREEERVKLEAVMRTLPKDQLEVVMMKIWEGLTFREIARVLGVPLDTAASRFRYALEKIKEGMVKS